MENESSEPTRPSQRRMPRAFFNIALNLLPLLGVWLFDWSIYAILCLYWLETLIALACDGVARIKLGLPIIESYGPVVFATLVFSAIQYVFLIVIGIFMDEVGSDPLLSPFTSEPSIMLNALAILVSHLYFALRRKSESETQANGRLHRALLRLAVQTGAILAAFAVGIAFGSKFIVAIIVLIALKTLFDFEVTAVQPVSSQVGLR